MSRRPEVLRRLIGEIERKTEQNRRMAADARETADAASQNATEVEQVSPPPPECSSQPDLTHGRLLTDCRSGDEECDPTV